MKVHFYFQSNINGDLDLNKFLPGIIKRFPDSKASMDTQFIGKRRIVLENPIQKTKIVKLGKNIDCDIDVSFKLYLYETIGYGYLDICLDINKEVLTKIMDDDKNLFNNIIPKSKIKKDGELKDFASSLIMPLFIEKLYGDKLFEDKSHSFYQNLEVDMDQISTKINNYKEKYHSTPIIIHFILSFDITLNPSVFSLIEDFDDELNVSSSWENISKKDNLLYQSNNLHARICKNKDIINPLEAFHFTYDYNRRIADKFLEWNKAWVKGLGKEVSNIRDNISKDNSNPYYWKQLKKRIEILDLNFLEFNSYVIQKIDFSIADKVELYLKEEYIEKIIDSNKNQKENIFRYLNEVKTAISNLSTPGHTHDEKILQEETEKVNDRILMLSFIAMSIPTIGAILTPGIEKSIKIMVGGGILFLPIIYLLIRNTIKKNRFNKNKQLESNRIIGQLEGELERGKAQIDDINNLKEMPEEFKNQLLEIHSTLLSQLESRIQLLKEKL